MTTTKKPCQLPTGRALKIAAMAARDLEDSTEALIGKQAARILRKFAVSPALAVTIAEIAFDHGRSA